MGQDRGRRGEAECQEAPIHHVEWREEPGKRKRKKRPGEEPDHQWRVHTQHKQPAAGTEQASAKARRHPPVSGHGDGLLRFFERGPRVHPTLHDDSDHHLASDTSKREDTPIEDPGSEITAGRIGEEDTETSIHGLLRSLDPNIATPGIPEDRPGEWEQLLFPKDEVGSSEAGDGSPRGCSSHSPAGSAHPARMLTLLQQEDLIKRFGALRPAQQIQKVMTTDTDKPSAVIPWRVTLALTNTHSTEMRGLWHQLSHSGLWQLILGRMRPATLHRTPLAQHLGKLLGDL